MKCFLITLYLVIQVYFALSSLPAPVNVSVVSNNFHHVLHWDPGPGTPPGTQYKIFRWVNKKKRRTLRNRSNMTTWCELKLDSHTAYFFSVQASHNLSLSAESRSINFTPYSDTVIGPPTLSLAGCGNCIRINISLPEADKSSNISDNDIQRFYDYEFSFSWKKAGGSQVLPPLTSSNKSFTLHNLEVGTEYCVQVHVKIRVNKKPHKPSDWMCAFTSILEPSRVPAVLGALSALLVVGGFAVVALAFCLIYTGVLCKLKDHLPRVLQTVLVQVNILTPESTIPDLVSIRTEPGKHRKFRNPRIPQPAVGGHNTEDEEEDDEEEDDEVEAEEKERNIYMYKAVEHSSGASSFRESSGVSGSDVPTVSRDSGTFSVKSAEVAAVVAMQDQGEAKDERAEVSLMEEKEEWNNSGIINLFSVTLGSLGINKEEEEEQSTRGSDSGSDFSELPNLQLLLPTGLQRTSSSAAELRSKTQSGDQTLALTPRPADCRATGYEGRRADRGGAGEMQPKDTQEEEEEEEEFLGYMGRLDSVFSYISDTNRLYPT